MGEFLKFLEEHYPVLFIIIIAIIAACLVSWQVFHWTHRIKKTESDCSKIDSQILPELKSIGNSYTSLNSSFKSLVIHLQAKDKTINAQLFFANSPLKLTELGEEILIKLGGKSFIDEHEEALITRMDVYGIKTALDSQNVAPIVINDVSNDDSFTGIKNYIFNNPFYKSNIDGNDVSVPLDLTTIADIMGIYLRDKYLKKHPELNPNDIP